MSCPPELSLGFVQFNEVFRQSFCVGISLEFPSDSPIESLLTLSVLESLLGVNKARISPSLEPAIAAISQFFNQWLAISRIFYLVWFFKKVLLRFASNFSMNCVTVIFFLNVLGVWNIESLCCGKMHRNRRGNGRKRSAATRSQISRTGRQSHVGQHPRHWNRMDRVGLPKAKH